MKKLDLVVAEQFDRTSETERIETQYILLPPLLDFETGCHYRFCSGRSSSGNQFAMTASPSICQITGLPQ